MPITLAPMLSVRNGARAVKFYKAAFAAVEVYRVEDPDGAVFARLSIGGADLLPLTLLPTLCALPV